MGSLGSFEGCVEDFDEIQILKILEFLRSVGLITTSCFAFLGQVFEKKLTLSSGVVSVCLFTRGNFLESMCIPVYDFQ